MLREEIGHRHSLREKFQPANVIPVGSSATRKLSERVVSFLYGRRELCCDASFPENYLVDLLFARMGPVATAHCGSSLVCAGNYSGVKLGGLGAACSARSIRWSPWPSSVKTASEAGLKAWIGRCDTICDARVTRRLMLQMTEQHGYELAPTLKLGAGKQLQHLAENAGYSCHGGAGPRYGSRLSTQTVAEFYRRSSSGKNRQVN
jgi:hypothetical protein